MADIKTYNIAGQDWHFSPFTQGLKRQYSNAVTARAQATAIELEMALQRKARAIKQRIADDDAIVLQGQPSSLENRDELVEDMTYLYEAAARQLQEFKDDRDSGRLHFTGSKCISAMRTMEGTVKMIMLSLAPNHPTLKEDEFTDLFKKNQEAFVDAIREVAGLGKKPEPSIKVKTEETTDETL